MGGTMPYDRLRYRNNLNDRRMDGDPYDLGSYRQPGGGAIMDEASIRKDYLQGEMNRMEQSYMGTYGGMADLPTFGARATGLTLAQVLSVMRWVFGLPEPDCADCTAQAARHPISQRCSLHMGYVQASGRETVTTEEGGAQ